MLNKFSISVTVIAVATYFANAEVKHGIPLWFFSIACVLLLFSVKYGKLNWFHTFISIFFLLGCWLKIIIHHIFDYPYIEAFGSFTDTEEYWGRYYVMASMFALSLTSSKIFFNLITPKKQTNWKNRSAKISSRKWIILMSVASILYGANSYFSFFVTGLNSKVAFPLGLGAPVAFMILIGMGVVTATYLDRDLGSRGYLSNYAIASLILVPAMASISMASRATLIMQAVPMMVAITYIQIKGPSRKVDVKPYYAFALILICVLIIVSIFRINNFSSSSVADTEIVTFYFFETILLTIDRWIGAEAIMVAVSDPNASMSMFFDLLNEDPAVGVNAMYQSIAGSTFVSASNQTFLTLPGMVGILGLSGSYFFVFIAMSFLITIYMALEIFYRKLLFNQDISVALASAGLANSLTQVSFPRLILPFLIQMTMLIIIINVISRKYFVKFSINYGRMGIEK